MNNILRPIILTVTAIVLLATTIIMCNSTPTNTMLSDKGCCSITVVTHEYDVLYDVIYTDNTNGNTHTERETRTVDMEYMVNLFQEHCYQSH